MNEPVAKKQPASSWVYPILLIQIPLFWFYAMAAGWGDLNAWIGPFVIMLLTAATALMLYVRSVKRKSRGRFINLIVSLGLPILTLIIQLSD